MSSCINKVMCYSERYQPSQHAYFLIQITLQKFDNRAVVVTKSEMLRWNRLGIEYMSEEHDDDDDPQVVIVHPPLWRSKRKFIAYIIVTVACYEYGTM